MYLLELKDVLGSLLLCSPLLLRLVLTDNGTGWRLVAYFTLQRLYDGLQGFQLGGGGLSLHLQRLSQRCALSGLCTTAHSQCHVSAVLMAESKRLRPPDSQPSAAVASVWPPCPCWALWTSPLSVPQSSASAAPSWRPCGARSTARTPPARVPAGKYASPASHAPWPAATRQPALPPTREGKFQLLTVSRFTLCQRKDA